MNPTADVFVFQAGEDVGALIRTDDYWLLLAIAIRLLESPGVEYNLVDSPQDL